MRQNAGKMRNPHDLRRQTGGVLHEVFVPQTSPNDISYGTYIRQNCRRGNWSSEYRMDFDPQQRGWKRVFLFADSTDAISFKMRFG